MTLSLIHLYLQQKVLTVNTILLNRMRFGCILSIVILSLTSCSDDTPIGNELNDRINTSPVEITVSAIGQESRTGSSRVYTDPSPLATDFLGHNLSLTYIYGSIGDSRSRCNVKWEDDSVATSATTKTRIWQQMSEMSNPMVWSNPTTDNARVYAYSPYVELSNPITQLSSIPFKVESNQTKGIVPSDFVRYYNTAFLPGANLNKLPIYFEHQLCKLTITLKEGPSKTITQGQIDSLAECKVGKVCDSINFNLLSVPVTQGDATNRFPVTTISGAKDDSTMVYTWVPEDCDSSTQVCIIPPQIIKKDHDFIHVNIYDPNTCFQKILVYKPDRNFTLEPNHHYKITVELCDTELKLSEVIVEGWIRENQSILDLAP